MKFPNMVFKSPGPYKTKGGTYNYVGVKDEDELNTRLAAGWHQSKEEALGLKKTEAKEVDDNAPPTRDELETKAKELGIKFGKNITDEKLGELIAKKLGD